MNANEDLWTTDLELAFQELRRGRNGVSFTDAGLEDAFQAIKHRRYHATPSTELRDHQLAEQKGE